MPKMTLDFSLNTDHMHPSKRGLKSAVSAYARILYTHLVQSPHKHLMASLPGDPPRQFSAQVNQDRTISVGIGGDHYDPPVQYCTCSTLFAALYLSSVPGGFAHEACPIGSWQDAPVPAEAPRASEEAL